MSQREDTEALNPRRRRMLGAAAWLGVTGLLGARAGEALAAGKDGVVGQVDLPFVNGRRPLVQYPGKRPLIRLTTRPPQLETPFEVFNDSLLTPNDAFFVRYHLAHAPPQSVDPDTFRLRVRGLVKKPLSLSLDELKTKFEPVEIVAVNQCSGNSRGYFHPRVHGGQLGNGAVGNARWHGVRLKDVLDKAGVAAGAKQVSFNGLDQPALEKTPDFVKALDIDHARDGEVMIAYAMNRAELPMLNGYPLRLVVPGWYGTYWVKHLSDITVLDSVFHGYWMDSAYRIPGNACACVPAGEKPAKTVPINKLNVRSFITSLKDGDTIKPGQRIMVRGIAFDGGSGIREVSISADGGQSWHAATLGMDLGNYSFREWRVLLTLPKPGEYALKVRAVNRQNQAQPEQALWNPDGYVRNVVETVRVKVG